MAHNLPLGSLDDFHKFRNAKYRHLYFCKSCVRNFEAAEAAQSCKFCGNGVKELNEPQKKEKFRYFCTKCDRNYTLSEKVEQCQACGHKFVHFYPWTMLRKRDKIKVRAMNIAKRLSGIARK